MENNNKAPTRNFGSSRNSLKLRDVVGRMFRLGSLVKAVKFLLFIEDYPEHSVIQNCHLITLLIAMVVPATFLVGSMLASLFASHGLIGFLAGYVGFAVLLLEIPHCIFDR